MIVLVWGMKFHGQTEFVSYILRGGFLRAKQNAGGNYSSH